MGESIFKYWCDSVGLIANSCQVDERGWDFFVEFPRDSSSVLLRDMLPTPIECKIQVKSTDVKSKKEDIKLSNLATLIKAPIPVFFCFIEFDGKNEAQAVYLVHVGKDIIEKTLKRIRKLDKQKPTERLNKPTIEIFYRIDNQLPEITGESLKKAIEKHILPGTLNQYISDKNELLNTLGFEDGKGEFTFTRSGSDPVGEMVDLSLGLRQEVNIDKSIGYHKRFGILYENQKLSSEGAILRIEAKPEPGVLKFKKDDFSPELVLSADLYLSDFFGKSLPEKYRKIRVKSTMFELILEPLNGERKYSFPCPDVRRRNSLNELKSYLKVLTLLKKASHPLVLEVSDKAKKRTPFSFKISVSDEIDDWSDVYNIVEMASSICEKLSISESDVLVSISELMQTQHSLENLYRILDADPTTVHINFAANPEEYEQGDRLACTSSVMTTIGSKTIRFFLAVVGSISLVNQAQYRLIAEDKVFRNKLVTVEGEVIEKSAIDRKFDEFEKELQRMGFATIRI
ncbi:hypothetical protein [Microcoleus asticus]|nr:hypothetical protein [Microcoleus asticus]